MSSHGVDHSAPMPLGHFPAIEKAVELRERHPGLYSWATISDVMDIYHGYKRSAGWWRRTLADRVPEMARGRAVYGLERVNVEARRVA